MYQALVLGVVQGFTEFVPVSSSAHLVLVPFVLRWPAPDLAFIVAVHLGTALAVVVYFARDLWAIAAGAARSIARRGSEADREHVRLLLLLVVGSIPAAVAGILLEGLFEDLFAETEAVDRIGAPVVGISLLATAGILLGAEAWYRRGNEARRRAIGDMTVIDALVVGLAQAVAIIPGISRSGATISGGMVRGLHRDAAARFSFLLSLPAILGAAIVALPDVPPGADLGPLVVGAAAAAITGFGAIAFLLRYLRTRTMRPFAVYCALASAVSLGFWFQIR